MNFSIIGYILCTSKKNLKLLQGEQSMQRHRRRAPGEQKRSIEALDSFLEIDTRIETHKSHRQLKADLELMKLENKLFLTGNPER